MVKKRKSFGQKLRDAQKSDFVGRVAQLALFQRNIEKSIEEDDFINIFNICGQGGVGKTTLMNKYRTIAKSKGYATVSIDTEDTQLLEVTQVMNAIAVGFEQQGFPFKKFQKKYKDYLQEKGKLEADPEKPKGGIGKLVNAGLQMGAKLGAEAVPGGSIMKGFLPINTLAETGGAWADYVAKKITNKDEVELILNPLKVLTPLWIEGLEFISPQREAAIFLDTFEISTPKLEQWLNALFKGKYGEVPLFLLVVSGRNPLDGSNWSFLADFMTPIGLEPFTEEEARSYLEKKGITAPEVIQSILAISNNLPVYLSLLAEGNPSGAVEISDPNEKVVERFLRHIQDPIKQQLALCAALPSQLNQDVIECLLPKEVKEKAKDYFKWLKSRPFVVKRGGFWTYHPVVKQMMLRYQRETSEKEWEGHHELLLQFYKNKALKLQVENERNDWFDDSNWRAILVQQYFHLLCINYKKNLPAFVRDIVLILLKYEYSIITPFINTILEAERVQKINDKWGAVLLAGVEELILEEDKKIILNLFRKINQSNFIVETEEKSKLYFLQGYYELEIEEAIASYKAALLIKPDLHEALNNLGVCYRDKGGRELAIESYKAALLISPDNHTILYNLGVCYFEQGEIEEAIASYKAALLIKPDLHKALYNLGACYFEQGEIEEGIASYKAALLINPEYYEALNNLGNCYFEQGEIEEGIASYKAALLINPEYHEALSNLGNCYFEQGEIEEAIASYKAALLIKPDLHKALYNLGVCYFEQGEIEEGIASYKAALLINPEYYEALNNLGNCYFKQGEIEEAIASYKAALLIKPDLHKALNNLGNCYFKQGEIEEAIASYKAALLIKPDLHKALYNLGVCYSEKGGGELAIESYKAALLIKPDLHEALNNLGICYSEKGEIELAIVCYKKALAIKPDDVKSLHSIGWEYLMKANLEEARAYFVKTWELSDKTYELAAMNLGNVFLLEGNLAKALEWYQQSKLLWDDLEELLKGLQSDFIELEMEKNGVSKATFDALIEELKLS